MIKFLSQMGRYVLLLKKVFSRPEKPSVYYKQTMHELVYLGLNSIGIITIISFFMGAVITLQTAYNTENTIYPTFIILPKIVATLVFNPFLTLISIIVGIVGGGIAGTLAGVITLQDFIYGVQY